MRSVTKRIEDLPAELRREVDDFVEFLIEKHLKKTKVKPNFSWAGALKELRERYTSVGLQHKISEWRIGEK